jgi:hypothetical protein
VSWTLVWLSLALQVTVVLIAVIAGRLHEWDLDRKHRHHHPGE